MRYFGSRGQRLVAEATGRQRGVGVTDLVSLMALVGAVFFFGVPSVVRCWQDHQLESAASEIQDVVLQARAEALARRTAVRIVFHDERSAVPNMLEVRPEAGSAAGRLHRIPEGVRILQGVNPGGMELRVGAGGECTPSKVVLRVLEAEPESLAISRSCASVLL